MREFCTECGHYYDINRSNETVSCECDCHGR